MEVNQLPSGISLGLLISSPKHDIDAATEAPPGRTMNDGGSHIKYVDEIVDDRTHRKYDKRTMINLEAMEAITPTP